MSLNETETEPVIVLSDDDETDIILPATSTDTPRNYNSGTPINISYTEFVKLRSAVVYTTRLDDMNIYKKNLDFVHGDNIINSIEVKSKPKLKHNRKSQSAPPFLLQDVDKKIDQINKKVAIIQKNQKLLKICKPLKVVLEDFRLKENVSESSTNYPYKVKTESGTYFLGDDFPGTEISEPNTIILVLTNKTSNKTEIYYFKDNSKMTAYFQLNDCTDDILQRYTSDKEYIKLQYCCWFDRKGILNVLPNTVLKGCSDTVLKFLNKPHECTFGQCKCCCVPKETKTILNTGSLSDPVSNVEVVKPNSSKDREWQLLSELNKDSIIFKALHYKRKRIEFDTNVVENRRLDSFIEIRYSFRIPERVVYWIDKNGDILFHSKNNKISHFYRGYETYIFSMCCWYDQNKILESVQKKHNINPRAIEFMRMPHRCISVCKCCCKTVHKPIIEKYSNKNTSTQNENKKTFNAESSENMSGTKSNFVTYHRKTCVPFTSNNDKNITSCAAKSGSKPIEMPKPIIVDNNKKGGPANQDTFVAKPINTPGPSNVSKSTDVSVDLLISTILERFKDVRLSINDDGKVAVALNTPVNTLTSAELKVLSQILSHAQKTVKELGIKPGGHMPNNTLSTNSLFDHLKINPQGIKLSPQTSNSQNQNPASYKSNLNTNEPTILNYLLDNSNSVINKDKTHFVIPTKKYNSAADPPIKKKNQKSVATSESNNFTLPVLIPTTTTQILPEKSLNSSTVLSQPDKEPVIFVPVIENVFSLQGIAQENGFLGVSNDVTNIETSERKMWYKKPEDDTAKVDNNTLNLEVDNNTLNLESLEQEESHVLKRKSVEQNPSTNKIRIVSPSKLGGKNILNIEETNTFSTEIPSTHSDKTAPIQMPSMHCYGKESFLTVDGPTQLNHLTNSTNNNYQSSFQNEFISMTQRYQRGSYAKRARKKVYRSNTNKKNKTAISKVVVEKPPEPAGKSNAILSPVYLFNPLELPVTKTNSTHINAVNTAIPTILPVPALPYESSVATPNTKSAVSNEVFANNGSSTVISAFASNTTPVLEAIVIDDDDDTDNINNDVKVKNKDTVDSNEQELSILGM